MTTTVESATAYTFLYMTDQNSITLDTKLLLGRPLFITKYQRTMKSIQPVRPVSTNSTFHIWAPSAHIVIFLTPPFMRFYLW
jgi:hypothetical protein